MDEEDVVADVKGSFKTSPCKTTVLTTIFSRSKEPQPLPLPPSSRMEWNSCSNSSKRLGMARV